MDSFTAAFTGTFSTTTAPAGQSLTFESILAVKQELEEQRRRFTRSAWAALGNQYGLARYAVADVQSIERFEQELGLDATCRPRWLHVSLHCPVGAGLFFACCYCLCHEPCLSLPPWMPQSQHCECRCVKEDAA
jgi:hypothetical protein